MDRTKALGSLIVTGLVFAAMFWVLYFVLHNLGADPTKDEKGNVVKDIFQRSKDILIVILPLATAAVGYWFGSDGKEKAEKKADEATAQVLASEKQKNAILDSAPPGVMKAAKESHGEVFG